MGEYERLADVVQRSLDEGDEPIAKDPGDDEAQTQIYGRADDALAQLFQVLHQAHAGQVGALGHRRPRLADCVRGINHGGLPAPWRERTVAHAPVLELLRVR